MKKLGRNDPCFCGSGKKLKKCCGSLSERARLNAAMQTRSQLRARREAQFGKVREFVSADFQGHKIVAVGNRLVAIPLEAGSLTAPTFLTEQLKWVMGHDWWNEETAKSPALRHPLVHLAAHAYDHIQNNGSGDGDLVSVEPEGASQEFLLVGYDLHLMRDQMLFKSKLLKRLRDPANYHGARFEMAVAATFLRAGFRLEIAAEGKGRGKSPDFYARHEASGVRLAVEAKRRHRRDGDVGERLGVESLISRAAEQVGGEPFALCLELNAPPPKPGMSLQPWVEEISTALDLAGCRTKSGSSKFSVVLVTNRYFEPGQSPVFNYLTAVPVQPARSLAEDLITALSTSLAQTLRVPNSLDTAEELNRLGARPV